MNAFKHGMRRVIMIATVLALLVGVSIGGYYGYRALSESARFELHEVILSGNRTVQQDEILSYAGLELGTPMINIDPGKVATRLAKHPWVRDTSVRRILPDKLDVEITERRAMAIAALDQLYLIDEEGEAFMRVRPAQLAQKSLATLPLITGIDRVRYKADQARCQSLFVKCIDLRQDVSESGLLGNKPGKYQLSEIHISQYTGLEIELEPGPLRLAIGWDTFAPRLARAQKVIHELQQRGIHARIIYLDNDNKPSRAVVRLAMQSP